jgi:hypothetical protein
MSDNIVKVLALESLAPSSLLDPLVTAAAWSGATLSTS